MNAELVSLKKEENNFKIYFEGNFVSSIINGLKYNFFGFKVSSYCKVLIDDEIYTFRCVRSMTNLSYSVFELTSAEGKKIVESTVTLIFLHPEVSATFVLKKDNEYIYLEYKRYSSHSSLWQETNKIKVASWEKNSFWYDNKVLLKESKELNLLIATTILLEKFQINNQKLVAIYFTLSAMAIVPILIFIFYISNLFNL